jgi:hypothetical protein
MRLIPLLYILHSSLCAGRSHLAQQLPKLATVTPVYRFAKGTWVENIAVRANGNLLVTRNDQPELWQVEAPSSKPAVSLVHHFANATRLAGITEFAPDQFAVITSDAPKPNEMGSKGPGHIWRVDLSGASGGGALAKAKVTRVTETASPVPNSTWLNGLAALPGPATAVLAGDSQVGMVYRVDLATGKAAVALADADTMDGYGVAGVNGVRVRGNMLYYTNTMKGLFARVPIDGASGKATGPPEVLVRDIDGVDDFALGPGEDEAYLTNPLASLVYRVDFAAKKATIVAEDVSLLNGPTSAQFGRAKGDEKTLYIVTNGGLLADPGNATGARVVSIKV